MTQNSIHLSLPYIQGGQAQKHITHNEAIRTLDSLCHLSIVSRRTEPDGAASEGDRYLVDAPATSDFAGQEGTIAQYENGGWVFLSPKTGWVAWDQSANAQIAFNGTSWLEVSGGDGGGGGGSSTTSTQLGINTSADTNNRLSVSSPATLLTHEGAGHQLKVNKASSDNTASLLFQSNWSARAEMGIVPGDDFVIKVSADGGTFLESLRFDGTTGTATGSAIQSSPQDTTTGRLARADWVYGPGNLLGTVSEYQGAPTGGVIERGSNTNGDFVRFADGTQICTATVLVDVTTTNLQFFGFSKTFAAHPSVSLSHTADFPNGPIQLSNIRMVRGVADAFQHWRLALNSVGNVATNQDEDRLMLTAVGRWL